MFLCSFPHKGLAAATQCPSQSYSYVAVTCSTPHRHLSIRMNKTQHVMPPWCLLHHVRSSLFTALHSPGKCACLLRFPHLTRGTYLTKALHVSDLCFPCLNNFMVKALAAAIRPPHPLLPLLVRLPFHMLPQQILALGSWLSSPSLFGVSVSNPDPYSFRRSPAASLQVVFMNPHVLLWSDASFLSTPQPSMMLKDGRRTHQACERHGEGPQLCSFDRSLHFQLRQHRTINCIQRLLFFVVVEMHHCPTTNRISSWHSFRCTINCNVFTEAFSFFCPTPERCPTATFLFPGLATCPFSDK